MGWKMDKKLSYPLNTPKRDMKPRTTGLTSLYDIGMPNAMAKSYMEDFADLVDIAKLAVGTGYVMPDVSKKVEMYQSYGMKVHFGGTLFEKFYIQGKFDEYLTFVKERGLDTIELSDGTIEIDQDDMVDMTKKACDAGFTVLVEVGSKDPDKIISPSTWIASINRLLDAGADYVITESRDSGSAGMFRPSGELRTGLVEDIGSAIDTTRLLFEAPNPKAQMYFINQFGSNVNLANVKPNDVLVLEAQRLGLRYETFHLGM